MPRNPPTPITATCAMPDLSTRISLMSPIFSLLAPYTSMPLSFDVRHWPVCAWVMNWTAPPDCALPDPLADWLLDEPLDFELSDPLADGWLDGLPDFELSDPLADGWLDEPPEP